MNINEIARLAGVSRATVSRYLNNGYVSSEKKEVIRRVIQETGYQPSSQAQTLRTKKTSLIGVILPKINSDTISREVTGISDILTRRGYQLILANTNNDVEEELKKLQAELDYTKGFLASVMKKLSNERFVSSAPEAVVATERAKQADAEAKIKVLEDQIASLK